LGLQRAGQKSEGLNVNVKKAPFHILLRKLSTVITPFYATLVTCATKKMLFNKSNGITAMYKKNVNCLLCFFIGPLSSFTCLSFVPDRDFTNEKTH